jgi:hypothetical protein
MQSHVGALCMHACVLHSSPGAPCPGMLQSAAHTSKLLRARGASFGGAGVCDAAVRWCWRRSCAPCGPCAHHVLAHAAAVLDRVSSLYSSGTLAETCLATVYALRSGELGCVLPAGSCAMRGWVFAAPGVYRPWDEQGTLCRVRVPAAACAPWAPFMYCAVSSGSSSRARYTQLEHQARHAGPYSCRYVCPMAVLVMWGADLHPALCCAFTRLLTHTALQHMRHTATVCFGCFPGVLHLWAVCVGWCLGRTGDVVKSDGLALCAFLCVHVPQ